MKKIIKSIIKIIIGICYFAFFYWLCLFSSSSFYGDFNLYTTIRSDSGEYYANIYKHLPTSPISIVQILGGNKYFTVLYNKKGEELWRVSYFDYIDEESVFDMMSFPDDVGMDGNFICLTNHGLVGYDISKTIRNHKLQ
ncbi:MULTISPECIES: DUF6201 family protein [Snodgrassella]|uniref:DUF6201 family protein n=1 Tax=Snodgrassella TaxID=1193515 RepID=UPI001EF50A2A|nr:MULTISPECIES: DUF6201 family protein [Snodgrassella]MCO6518917.1 hypothetical protein [Snodgrassella sp.]